MVEIFRKRLDTLDISDYHGLISPGLTCYLNTVLQVLFMTEEFRDQIKRCVQDVGTLDTHLKDFFTELEKNKTKTHHITQILGIDDVYEQRDAAEYFEKVLRLTSPKASKIFKGELNHVTKCYKCQNQSEVRGFFWILPLSIKEPHQTFKVDRGLKEFFCAEKVDGENKMYCAKCDKKQEAIIMCEMTQPPDVLTLLLKRFHYDYELKRNVKLHCDAEVPLMLQIKGCTYDLYAMVKHTGNLSGGHYVANILSVATKAWYCFDDQRVKLKSNLVSGKSSLRSHSAYLLMYMKRRDPENATENEEEVLNSGDEAKETMMEARWNREVEALEDYRMLEKRTETSKDIIRRPSSKSQIKPNGLSNSADAIVQYEQNFSNKRVSDKKTVSHRDIYVSVYKRDYQALNYSPKTRRRSDHPTVLPNKSTKSTKLPTWK